jgi:hypothetical protein
MLLTLDVQRVVVFLYVESRHLLHNLTDMHRKVSACIDLRVAMVPESYQHVTSAPVLVLPNDDLLFRLEADGSSITTGAVLSQQSVNDNAWHPVAFLSKALNPVEQNYEIYDTEMLAII